MCEELGRSELAELELSVESVKGGEGDDEVKAGSIVRWGREEW